MSKLAATNSNSSSKISSNVTNNNKPAADSPQNMVVKNSFQYNNSNYSTTNRTTLPKINTPTNASTEPLYNPATLRRMKECNLHYTTDHDTMLICETCERHYYPCEICREARSVEAPITMCIKCAPAVKTIKALLQKKEVEIQDLKTKIRRFDSDLKQGDDAKRQLLILRKQNDDMKLKLKKNNLELNEVKEQKDKINTSYETLTANAMPRNELVKDLRNLLLTSDMSDCTITCNGQKYPAHKCILSARSLTLRKLLNPHLYPELKTSQSPQPGGKKGAVSARGGDNKQGGAAANRKPQAQAASNNNNKNSRDAGGGKGGKGGKEAAGGVSNIDLNDINPNMMHFVLNHIYTGETDNEINDQNMHEMLRVAQKLELDGLKEAVLIYMETRLKRSTVAETLFVACELNNERLMKKCIDFIIRENMDIEKSPLWVPFKTEHPKMALEIYERYTKERDRYSPLLSRRLGYSAHDLSHINTDSVTDSWRSPRDPHQQQHPFHQQPPPPPHPLPSPPLNSKNNNNNNNNNINNYNNNSNNNYGNRPMTTAVNQQQHPLLPPPPLTSSSNHPNNAVNQTTGNQSITSSLNNLQNASRVSFK